MLEFVDGTPVIVDKGKETPSRHFRIITADTATVCRKTYSKTRIQMQSRSFKIELTQDENEKTPIAERSTLEDVR